MAKLARKWGMSSGQLGLLVTIISLLVSVLGTIGWVSWSGGERFTKVETALEDNSVQHKALKAKLIEMDSVQKQILKRVDVLEIIKEDKKAINPTDVKFSFLNLGPVKDTTTNYFLTFSK